MSTNMVSDKSRFLGEYGELFASEYLVKCLGWTILEKNVRTRYGEIDIVALDSHEKHVFVEVRTRTNHRFGTPIQSVSALKVAKLTQQIRYYMAKHSLGDDTLCCLDVIGLCVLYGVTQTVHHIRVYPDPEYSSNCSISSAKTDSNRYSLS